MISPIVVALLAASAVCAVSAVLVQRRATRLGRGGIAGFARSVAQAAQGLTMPPPTRRRRRVPAAAPRPARGAPRRRFSPPRGHAPADAAVLAARQAAPAPDRPRRFERPAPDRDQAPSAGRFQRVADAPPPAEPPRAIRDEPLVNCHIGLSETAARTLFYARPPGGGAWLAASPSFRVEEGRTVADSPAARQALDALLTQLRADGWQVAGAAGSAPWQLELTHAGRAPAEAP